VRRLIVLLVVAAVVADNDATNLDMLALNDHLGYRRLLVVGVGFREGAPTPAE
jgi:hypothetical protein